MVGVMDGLLARLEKATGPDPHLDADIEVALRGGVAAYRVANRYMGYPASAVLKDVSGHPSSIWEISPSFTGLLDAAASLVPPGRAWKLIYEPGRPHRKFCAVINTADRLHIVAPSVVASAETGPLALVTAALLARRQ